MNAELLNKNILRFVILGLIQGVILQSIDLAYVEFFIFPLFILMFPLGLSDSLFLLICFAFGLYIDMFYNTMGLFISTADNRVLNIEPGGYFAIKALLNNGLSVSVANSSKDVFLFLLIDKIDGS